MFYKEKDLGEIYVTPKSNFGDVSDEEVYKVVGDVILYRYIVDCEGQLPGNVAGNTISFVKVRSRYITFSITSRINIAFSEKLHPLK